MIDKSKIIKILDKPFGIYKIDNFLDNNFYSEIENNFPNFKEEFSETDYGKSYLRMDKSSNNSNVLNNKILKSFHDFIYSKKFFNFFIKNFYYKSIENQNSLIKKLFYAKYPSEKRYFLFNKMNLKYEFSLLKNNTGIVPHVDSQRKYLSLMLYFPSREHNDSGYGTTFWKSKYKNYSNKHIKDINEINNFKDNSEIIYKTPFNSNTLYIFLRNECSWHSVEPKNISENYWRRSININFVIE